MSGNLTVELRSGREGPASVWRYHLPANSRALEGFEDPASIVLQGTVVTPGQPPQNPGCRMKVYVGEKPGWVDTDALIAAFTQLWPDALQAIGTLNKDAANLVYFSAPATLNDLYDLWPHMPFGPQDESRFFVSEVCRSSRTRAPVCGRLCVEYAYDDFKRMAGPDGFGFPYGTAILGICVREARVPEYLRLDFLDKNALERALGDDHLRCWWFCDADFEGMTIWHKDFSAGQLMTCLSKALRRPVEQLGLVLREVGL